MTVSIEWGDVVCMLVVLVVAYLIGWCDGIDFERRR